MKRIYYEGKITLNTPFFIQNTEYHHLVRVLRSKVGEKFIVFDAEGKEFLAEIIEITPFKIKAIPLCKNSSPAGSSLSINLVQAILKGKKMDIIIEKATELGVKNIFPLVSEFTVPKEVSDNKLMHWQRKAISAAKQSLRNTIPTIYSPCKLKELSNYWQSEEVKLIFWEKAILSFKNALSTMPHSTSTVWVVLGAEGGWSEEEIDFFIREGGKLISLGPRILRAETATIAVFSVLNYELSSNIML